MKKTITLFLSILMLLSLFAGCGGSKEEVTFDDYKAWLIEAFVERSPDPEGIKATLEALTGWEDIDINSQPWDMFFSENGYNASTWDEFVAAGGVGTFNADVEVPETSGEPSGDASGEPAA